MYRAHSKDINRNKSFHPITFSNLRKVERLKEARDEHKQAQVKRAEELRRDQEEKRYDELAGSSSRHDSSGLSHAHFSQVKNIFAAEYEGGTPSYETRQAGEEHLSSPAKKSTNTSSATIGRESKTSRVETNVLSKFHKVEISSDVVCAKRSEKQPKLERHDTASSTMCGDESQRLESSGSDRSSDRTLATVNRTKTGHISAAEALQLQKELELTRKQKLDPMRRVTEFQNSVVSCAAQSQHTMRMDHDSQTHRPRSDTEKQKVSKHINELMNLIRNKIVQR